MICNSLKQLFRILDFRSSACHCLYFFLMFFTKFEGSTLLETVCSSAAWWQQQRESEDEGWCSWYINSEEPPLFFCSLIYKYQYSGAMRVKWIWLIYIVRLLKRSTTKSNGLVTYTEVNDTQIDFRNSKCFALRSPSVLGGSTYSCVYFSVSLDIYLLNYLIIYDYIFIISRMHILYILAFTYFKFLSCSNTKNPETKIHIRFNTKTSHLCLNDQEHEVHSRSKKPSEENIRHSPLKVNVSIC